jgi:hypothetical protein
MCTSGGKSRINQEEKPEGSRMNADGKYCNKRTGLLQAKNRIAEIVNQIASILQKAQDLAMPMRKWFSPRSPHTPPLSVKLLPSFPLSHP